VRIGFEEEESMSEHGCPGARMIDMRNTAVDEKAAGGGSATQASAQGVSSELRQWPVQLHLVQPTAPYFRGADVLLTADCVAYAMGGFHPEHLRGKSIAIACPKLDDGQEEYVRKVRAWIEEAQINTLTVMIMQVPCCGGLLNVAMKAAEGAKRKVPVKSVVVSLKGEVLQEEWVQC
jgi:hypothetical protein